MISLLHMFACITCYYFIFIPRKLQDFFVNKETYCSDTDTILGKQTFMYYYAFWKKGPKISLKQVFEHQRASIEFFVSKKLGYIFGGHPVRTCINVVLHFSSSTFFAMVEGIEGRKSKKQKKVMFCRIVNLALADAKQ